MYVSNAGEKLKKQYLNWENEEKVSPKKKKLSQESCNLLQSELQFTIESNSLSMKRRGTILEIPMVLSGFSKKHKY